MKTLFILSLLFIYSSNLKAEAVRELVAACKEHDATDDRASVLLYRQKRFLRKPIYEIDSVWTNLCTGEADKQKCKSIKVKRTSRLRIEHELAKDIYLSLGGGREFDNKTTAYFSDEWFNTLTFYESFDNNPSKRYAELSTPRKSWIKLKCYGVSSIPLVRKAEVDRIREEMKPELYSTTISPNHTWSFERPCSLARIRGTATWQVYNQRGYFSGNYYAPSEELNNVILSLAKVCKVAPADLERLLERVKH
ncbi:MAG: hypothetical protein JNM93_01725 [Bacteriovoracaceae bacterium]|nr:hypothetical protein [Bacteriovoracaceae bacterium]